MRSPSTAILCLALAAAPLDAASTTSDSPVQSLKRAAVSGERQQVGFEYSLDDETCMPVAPTVAVRIVTPPAHGALEVVEDEDFPNYPPGSTAHKCNARKALGRRIYYRSDPGYSGPDNASIEITFPTGKTRVVVYPIEVWAPASVEKPR